MNIFKKVANFYNKQLPFVVYRKPNADEVSGLFLEDDTVYHTENFTESGFVFSPFDSEEKSVLLPIEKSEFITEKLLLVEEFLIKNDFEIDESSKENHIHLVEKALDVINEKVLQKVVVSRKELVALSDFDLLIIYKKLLQTYKNAFVYVWFHPKVGLWLGATPETLLDVKDAFFKTMSLAGTQVFNGVENVVWKSKELEEQQLVTNFISSQLNDIASNLQVDKTETIRAGSLLHLRTKVEGELNNKSTLKKLIRALHPTPAVCGLPREKAKEFILKNENYNRSFYTGFLGELNLEHTKEHPKNSSLFVNLRCMSIENNTASIYIGGGITKDSNAKKEWEETVAKSKVMKRVL